MKSKTIWMTSECDFQMVPMTNGPKKFKLSQLILKWSHLTQIIPDDSQIVPYDSKMVLIVSMTSECDSQMDLMTHLVLDDSKMVPVDSQFPNGHR